jgi:hypothetical protein
MFRALKASECDRASPSTNFHRPLEEILIGACGEPHPIIAGEATTTQEAQATHMRLKPGLTSAEAYEMLTAAAKLSWGADAATSIESQLREIAQAMEVIGNVALDENAEPLFGENEELPESLA